MKNIDTLSFSISDWLAENHIHLSVENLGKLEYILQQLDLVERQQKLSTMFAQACSSMNARSKNPTETSFSYAPLPSLGELVHAFLADLDGYVDQIKAGYTKLFMTPASLDFTTLFRLVERRLRDTQGDDFAIQFGDGVEDSLVSAQLHGKDIAQMTLPTWSVALRKPILGGMAGGEGDTRSEIRLDSMNYAHAGAPRSMSLPEALMGYLEMLEGNALPADAYNVVYAAGTTVGKDNDTSTFGMMFDSGEPGMMPPSLLIQSEFVTNYHPEDTIPLVVPVGLALR